MCYGARSLFTTGKQKGVTIVKMIDMVPFDIGEYLSNLNDSDQFAYGQEICIEHPVYGSMEFCRVYKADATAKGDFVIFNKTGTAGGLNPTAIAPATTATPLTVRAGAAQHATSGAGGVWVQTKGRCICCKLDGGTDVADGNLLSLTNGQVYCIKDAAFGQETIGVAEEAETKSIAEQLAAGETVYDHQIYLFGHEIVV